VDPQRAARRAHQAQLAADAARAVSRDIKAWLVATPGERTPARGTDVRVAGLRALLLEAILASGADCGNVQLLGPGGLRIAVQHGFGPEFLAFFDRVEKPGCACGAAMRDGARIVVEEVCSHPIFRGAPAEAVMREARIGAVQSTPLVGASGALLGMLSTHHRKPRRFDAAALQRIDRVAARAARWIEIPR
jgi:GAF domain-containing protein